MNNVLFEIGLFVFCGLFAAFWALRAWATYQANRIISQNGSDATHRNDYEKRDAQLTEEIKDAQSAYDRAKRG